jgi:hypothetical protein
VKCEDINWPSICDFTCTVEYGSAVPTARNSTGTRSSEATAMLTGTGGIPPAAAAADCAGGPLHPARTAARPAAHNHMENFPAYGDTWITFLL